MSFLVPAFLAGLLLVGVPIWIHLTRRQRQSPVAFPSLMFLQRTPYTEENRRRIQHWALLSVRFLAIVLLVLAFARPFLDRSEEVAATGGGPTERVVLLDRSWSMGFDDRLEEARRAARDAISSLGPLDRASVIAFGQGASAVVRSTADGARLRAGIDTISLSSEATRYGPALKLAQTILEETELPGRELVVISDFQQNGWTGDEGVVLPAGTRLRPVRIGDGTAPANHAVSAVSLAREEVQGRERVTPTARLTRIGGDSEVQLTAELRIDGQLLQTQTVSLPANGAAALAFQPFTLSQPHTQGEIRLEGDALPDDDALRFVLSAGRALGVRLLSGPTRGNQGDLYLRRALAVSDGGSFDVVGLNAVPSAEVLDRVDAVLFTDRPVPGGVEGGRLREWVAAGGGVVLIAGERGRWPEELSDLFPGPLGGAVDREDGRGERLASVDFAHPVFELFAGPRSGDFTGIRFYRARRHQVEEDEATRVLARFDDGGPALTERRVGEGRVLVFTSTLDAFWTDFALQPVFLPFVHQLVRYASGRGEEIDAFTTGQVLDVSDARAMETAGLGEVAEAIAASEARVAFTPSGAAIPLDDPFLTLDQAGFWEIRPPGADEVRPVSIAVNVDPEEALLDPLDPEEFAATLGSASRDTGTEGARATELRRADQEQRQSWWRLLLFAAFALLAVDTIWSNRVARTTRRLKDAQATG